MSEFDQNPYHPGVVPPSTTQQLSRVLSALEEFEGIGRDGEVVQYSIAAEAIHPLLQNRLWVKVFEAFLVPDIVQTPLRIWEGLNREGTEDLLCIAGVPSLEFATKNFLDNQITLQEDRVFLAFCSSQFTVSKWRWEPVDSDGFGLPTSHNARFGREMWSR